MRTNFNTQMLPAQVTGREFIPIVLINTSPAAGVPLKIPNPEARTVSVAASRAKEVKELDFNNFPKLQGFV